MDGFERRPGLGVQGYEAVEDLGYERVGGGEGDVHDVVGIVLDGLVDRSVISLGKEVCGVARAGRPDLHRLDSGAGVAWRVEFGNHAYAALPGIAQDLDEIGVGVITVCRRVGVTVQRSAVGGLQGVWLLDGAVLLQLGDAAERSVGSELRQTVYLYPPALVVAEVQVQAAYLVMGQDVDEAQQVVFFGEIAADVQHHAPVLQVGPVGHDPVGHGRAGGIALNVVQGYGSVESPVLVGGLDADLAVDCDAVPSGDLPFDEAYLALLRRGKVGRALRRLKTLDAGDHVVHSRGYLVPREGLRFFGGKETVRNLYRDRLLPFLLQVETFGGTALVYERLGFVGQRHILSAGIGAGDHPVEGAAHMLDRCG